MRTITHGDISVAARATCDLEEDAARAMVRRWLCIAHAADLYRKHFGRAHPCWGNGTLTGAAMRSIRPRPEPFLADVDYLQAMARVIDTVLVWRKRGEE